MDVQLPPAVARQLAEAEAIEAGMAAPAAEPAPEAPAVDPTAAPAPEPAAAPPATPEAPTPEPWEQRYKTLQGMYDADVRAGRTQAAELTKELDDLRKRVDAAPAAETPKPPAAPQGITQKDVDEFGAELIEVIKRVALAQASELLAPLQAQVKDLVTKAEATSTTVQTVATTQKQDISAKFLAQLTELVPDWAAVNADARFLEWCVAVNPLTGKPNQELLEAASNSFSATRVAAIFNAYKLQAGIVTAPPATAAPAAPTAAKAELASQIAPGTSRSSAPAPAPTDRSFTAAEVQQFYTAISKGEYRGKEAEATALEAEIDRAAAAGRVR